MFHMERRSRNMLIIIFIIIKRVYPNLLQGVEKEFISFFSLERCYMYGSRCNVHVAM